MVLSSFSLFLVHLLHPRDCVYMWILLTFKSRVVCVLYISIMADGTSIVGILQSYYCGESHVNLQKCCYSAKTKQP